MNLSFRSMKRIPCFILLLNFGVALCNPYYYRESKQHSEHHKEVSYDGSSSPESPTAGHEGMSVLYYKPTPEKYFSAVSPIHSSGFQSQSGGYSYSQGSLQQSPLFQNPTASRLTEYPSNGGNVIVRKYVNVYSYPATTSQASYVQFGQSKSGSDVLGSEKHIENLQGNYFPAGQLHSAQHSQVHKIIRTEHSTFGRHSEGSLESGQKEESEELGQKEEVAYDNPYGGQLELGQKEEALSGQYEEELGQKAEDLYANTHSGRLELGQQEEPLGGPHSIVTSKKEESVHVSSQRGDLEIGQQEVPLQQPLRKQQVISTYQREMSIPNPTLTSGSVVLGQKPIWQQPTVTYSRHAQSSQLGGSTPVQVYSYHNHYSSHRGHNPRVSSEKHSEESGQIEESLYGGQSEIGQKEELLSGQQEEVIGQKEESLYGSSHVNLGRQVVNQKQESLYENIHNEQLEIGQKEESLYGQQEEPIGQKEERHYESSHAGNIELGQKEEPLNGQIEEIVGQKEEPIDLNGQREVSLYVNSHQGRLEVGQKPGPLSGEHIEAIGQKEESLYQNSHSGHVEFGQHEETLDGTGQKEDSLNINTHNENPVSSHHSYAASHRQESVHIGSHSGGLELGQREESPAQRPIVNTQKVENLYVSNPGHHFELGQREEPSNLGLGQKPEPLQSPLGKQQSVSVYHREVSINNKPVWSQTHYTSSGPKEIEPSEGQRLTTGPVHTYHSSISSQKNSLCEHDMNYLHGGFGSGQTGHDRQISQFSGFSQGTAQTRKEDRPDTGDSLTKGPDGNAFFGRNKHTTFQSYSSSVQRNEQAGIESSTSKVANIIPIPSHKPQQGAAVDMNKKIDDLILEFGLGDAVKRTNTDQELRTTTGEKQEETTSRTTPADIHTAEIQELGLEDFSKKSISEFSAFQGAPQRGITVFESHRQETGPDYPSTRKSYSKKHSRQYSATSEEFSTRIQPRRMESYSLQSPLKSSGQVAGSTFSYSHQGGSYVNDQPVQKQEVSRTEFFGGSQQGNKHAVIDEFLTELEKDIARNNKRPQSGFVQVSSQQQPSSSAGSSYYSERSYSSQSSHSSSSGGEGGRSWFQKVGENIGSTYNKAVEKIGTTYTQAREKAKEIVGNVKQKVGY